NQEGMLTAWAVSGILPASAVAMGTMATAATPRATPAATTRPHAAARPWAWRLRALVSSRWAQIRIDSWVRSTTIASTTAPHSDVKVAKRLDTTFWTSGIWARTRHGG